MVTDFRIYSFSNSDLNPEIAIHQKLVFDRFKIPLTQVVWEKNEEKYGRRKKADGSFLYDDERFNDRIYNDHPYFLEKTIRETGCEYLIFFDVDCIPLSDKFLEVILNDISDKNTLSGALQSCDVSTGKAAYVGAYFAAFSRSLYFDCGQPVITDKVHADPFQNFTDSCFELGKRVKYWMPTSSKGNWYIPAFNIYYGHGTTFDNMIYHQFQIRYKEQEQGFIEKCKSLLQ